MNERMYRALSLLEQEIGDAEARGDQVVFDRLCEGVNVIVADNFNKENNTPQPTGFERFQARYGATAREGDKQGVAR